MGVIAGTKPQPSQTSKKWHQTPPFRYFFTLYYLFFTRKFLVHRLSGLAYLLQFIAALFLYFYDYQKFKSSPLVITLPLWGVLQSVTAALTFTFLPKKKKQQGFFGDKGTITYESVVENSFYAGLVCFHWLYYHDTLFEFFKKTVIIENILVFLPYLFRPLWPKTHFRDSLRNLKDKTDKNAAFYFYGVWLTKIWFIWAKHMMTNFLNYIRFMERVTEGQIYHIYLLFFFISFAGIVSLFLHTLKFKGYIGPRTAFVPYVVSYLATLYSIARISETLVINWDIAVLAAIGIPLNFCSRTVQLSYQVLLMIGFNAKRYGIL